MKETSDWIIHAIFQGSDHFLTIHFWLVYTMISGVERLWCYSQLKPSYSIDRNLMIFIYVRIIWWSYQDCTIPSFVIFHYWLQLYKWESEQILWRYRLIIWTLLAFILIWREREYREMPWKWSVEKFRNPSKVKRVFQR